MRKRASPAPQVAASSVPSASSLSANTPPSGPRPLSIQRVSVRPSQRARPRPVPIHNRPWRSWCSARIASFGRPSRRPQCSESRASVPSAPTRKRYRPSRLVPTHSVPSACGNNSATCSSAVPGTGTQIDAQRNRPTGVPTQRSPFPVSANASMEGMRAPSAVRTSPIRASSSTCSPRVWVPIHKRSPTTCRWVTQSCTPSTSGISAKRRPSQRARPSWLPA
jgi:hypothetical protein